MLNAIAIVILGGMMFIPIINFVVGIIIGTLLCGITGGFAGAALATVITLGPSTLALANRQAKFPVLVRH